MATISNFSACRERQFLVVEDEGDLAKLIRLHLQDLNASVEICHDGQLGLNRALAGGWDLVVLDLRLPGLDGLDVCRHLRSQESDVPILMLTARSTELDRVLGLELGADDYLTKPFSPLELVARSKALLRRSEHQKKLEEPNQVLRHGNLVIDCGRRELRIGEQLIELTSREFDLLWFFASNPDHVFRRSELLDKVWGYGHEGYEHTVNSHINRLRTKLGEFTDPSRYIVTVWGVGYKFHSEPRAH